MTISFGVPGSPRKTFDDKKFDLQGGVYSKWPCPLQSGLPAGTVKDGQFLAPDGLGAYVPAPDADRALFLMFTANNEVIVKEVTAADEFPGEERTNTPTGLQGKINGVWSVDQLFLGATGGGAVTLADYDANQALTVKAGKLCPANFGTNAGEKVIGYVDTPNTWAGGSLGSTAGAIAASIDI
jgi:hypothetical protein